MSYWGIKEGANLTRLRMAKGMSQEYVAGKIGSTKRSVQNWESGRDEPSKKFVHHMAFLYSVPISEITGFKEDDADAEVKTSEIPVEAVLAENNHNNDIRVAPDGIVDPNNLYTLYVSPKAFEIVKLMAYVQIKSCREIVETAIREYALMMDWEKAVSNLFAEDLS